jgi:hypothetical protein
MTPISQGGIKPNIPLIQFQQNQVLDPQILYSLVGGKEKYDQLPPYNFLGQWDSPNQYENDHPNWVSIKNMQGSINRGINGKPGYDYLVVKYHRGSSMNFNRSTGETAAILYFDKDKIQESWIDGTLIGGIRSMYMNALCSSEKTNADFYKELLTEGCVELLGNWVKLAP